MELSRSWNNRLNVSKVTVLEKEIAFVAILSLNWYNYKPKYFYYINLTNGSKNISIKNARVTKQNMRI